MALLFRSRSGPAGSGSDRVMRRIRGSRLRRKASLPNDPTQGGVSMLNVSPAKPRPADHDSDVPGGQRPNQCVRRYLMDSKPSQLVLRTAVSAATTATAI